VPENIADNIASSSAFLLGSLISKGMRDSGLGSGMGAGERLLLIDGDYLFEKDNKLKEKISQGYKVMGDYIKNTITNILFETTQYVAGSLVSFGDTAIELVKYTAQITNVLRRYFSGEPTGIYEFRINPVTAKFGYNKIQQVKEYGYEHYVVQSYGDRMVDLPFSGTTGSLFPPRKIIEMGLDDIRLSFPYYKLLEFEKFYLNADRMIVIIFFDFMMFGYLNNFNYTFDAKDPRQVRFDFSIKFDPRSKFHLFSTDIGEYLNKLKGMQYNEAIPTTIAETVYEPNPACQSKQGS